MPPGAGTLRCSLACMHFTQQHAGHSPKVAELDGWAFAGRVPVQQHILCLQHRTMSAPAASDSERHSMLLPRKTTLAANSSGENQPCRCSTGICCAREDCDRPRAHPSAR